MVASFLFLCAVVFYIFLDQLYGWSEIRFWKRVQKKIKEKDDVER